jgi:hypothetical protein
MRKLAKHLAGFPGLLAAAIVAPTQAQPFPGDVVVSAPS